MNAIILHTRRDEQRAAALAGTFVSGECVRVAFFSPDEVRFGDHLAILAIWSAHADEEAFGSTVQAIAEDAQGRLLVIRADDTPVPELPRSVGVARFGEDQAAFAAKLKVATGRAGRSGGRGAAPRRQEAPGRGLGVGVGMGLAIYAGMFVAAGAWRSEELAVAADSGRAPQVVHGALRSFKTAFGQERDFHVAASGSGQFETIHRAQPVAADAGLIAVDAAQAVRAATGGPDAAVAPGLAAAGAASLGIATSFASVTVGGNEAY